jgi:hypothetical protein
MLIARRSSVAAVFLSAVLGVASAQDRLVPSRDP